MDWHGSAGISCNWQVSEVGELMLDPKMTRDWHRIGTGLAKLDQIDSGLVQGVALDGIWLALDWHVIGSGLTSDCPRLVWIVQNWQGLANKCYWLGWKIDSGLALNWHWIGQDWHWLARTGHDWLELIMIGNAQVHPPSRLGTIPYRQLVLWLRT